MPRRPFLRGASIALGALLASCLPGGPPHVPAHATLGPGPAGGPAGTVAPLAVVFAGPHGVTSLTEPAVTVLFNRAMREADAPETAGVPAISLTTDGGGSVAGAWRFLGTHGLLFTPDRPLAGSTRFRVKVPAGTRALDGDVLRSDYGFDFSTPRPTIEDTDPPEGASDLRPESALTLRWNEPVGPAEVERGAHLRVRAQPTDKPRTIVFHAARAERSKHPEETLVLTPAEKLPADSEVELVLDKGLRGEGPLGALASRTLSFRTYGPQRLVDVRCPRATGPRCQAHRDVTVVLANPVAPDELRAHLVAPGMPPAKATATTGKPKEAPKPSREQLLHADPAVGARYHLRLTRGMRDVFGQTLARDLTFDVDVEAPFVVAGKAVGGAGPSSPAQGSAEDGEGHAAPTEPEAAADPRPRRPQLAYEVKVGLAGRTFEALAHQGIKGHKVPVGSVNVPTYGLFAGPLAEDDAMTWLGQRPRRGRGAPSAADLRWSWISAGAPENVRSVRTVDLDALLAGSSGRGAAMLATVLPGDVGSPTTEIVSVTDLAVSAKMSPYGSDVWVTRLSTGAAVAGATVSVFTPKKGETFRTASDAEGIAAVPVTAWSPLHDGVIDEGALVVVRAGDDWTWQRVERAAASYRSGVALDLAQKGAWAGIVYTDRGVYRPGETMKLAALFRRVDAKGVAIAAGEEVRVAVKDAQDEAVFDGRAKLDAFGEAVLDVPLPKTAHLGEAHVVAELGRKGGDSFSAAVQLAAYKASEFKVTVEPDRADHVRGDSARFTVTAEYLFGAPMKGATLSDHVTRAAASFTPPHTEGLVTTDEANVLDWPETNPKAEEVRDKDGATDDDGRDETVVKLDLPRMRGPEDLTLESEVTDLTHQTVARRATVRVHPASFYLGLERVTPRFLAVGADARAAVAAVDPTGARVAGVQAHAELVRRTWTGVTLDDDGATPRKRSRVKDEVVGRCDVVTSFGPSAACALHVAEPGFYILRARASDARGNSVGASQSFYALDDRADTKASPVAWADPDGSGLRLEPDKKRYDAGEVAKILVRNPFKEADAWITVERAGVLTSRIATLKGPMPVVEVPIEDAYFPNVFVGVHLVRGRVSAPPESGADVGAPAFRLGVVRLDVNPETHRLKVAVTPTKKEYRPGEEVDASVAVTGRDGRAARAAVTFYAVDEGVLLLTSYETPDPLPAFATTRRLSVFDVESRESLAHLLSLKNGARVSPLGWEYLGNRGGDKGGEGGGGGEGLRADFKTTAFFDAEQVTDAEGRARYHFKLPDNLTSFRLMAVAAGADDRFGSGDATITTSRKLMARPALPRVVRAGDAFEAGVVVSSRDLPATMADVSIRVTGLELAGPASRKVAVPKGGSVDVRFPVRARDPGEATIELAVSGGGEKDAVVAKRTVELAVTREVTSTYGDTIDAAAVAMGDLSRVRGDEGGLEVHVASTALVGLGTSFERAIDYPYGCTEQLTSRVLPLLVLPDMARDFGARMPAHIDDAVDAAIGELLTHQTNDGGFGFWAGDDAVPWLSAYAMLAVEAAAKRGLFVPKSARDAGVEYLRHELDHAGFGDDADEDSATTPDPDTEADPGAADSSPATSPAAKKTHAFATAAFVADVLATLGQPDPGYLHRLFDARRGRPLFAEAMLLHGMAISHMPRGEVVALAKEIAGRLRVGATEAFAEEPDTTGLPDLLDSSARTSALVLRALVAVDPADPVATPLARGLLARRVNGAWRSTQENVWALLALHDYRDKVEATVPDFDARVFLGGDRLGEVPFHGRSTRDERIFVGAPRVAGASGEALTFQLLGQGRLFYSAELRYASKELPARSTDRGLFVQKLVRAVTPDDLKKAMETLPNATAPRAPVGQLVLVDLLLESAEPREQIVIEDPLPAGLEPIDFALDTAARTRPVTDDVTPAGDPKRKAALFDYGAFKAAPGMHREQKDDRVLTFLPHVEPGLYHFRYVARATTPGEFVVPPTRAECMYSPEVWGRSAASTFVVSSAPATTPVARR